MRGFVTLLYESREDATVLYFYTDDGPRCDGAKTFCIFHPIRRFELAERDVQFD